jgi:hypothetical protein
VIPFPLTPTNTIIQTDFNGEETIIHFKKGFSLDFLKTKCALTTCLKSKTIPATGIG